MTCDMIQAQQQMKRRNLKHTHRHTTEYTHTHSMCSHEYTCNTRTDTQFWHMHTCAHADIFNNNIIIYNACIHTKLWHTLTLVTDTYKMTLWHIQHTRVHWTQFYFFIKWPHKTAFFEICMAPRQGQFPTNTHFIFLTLSLSPNSFTHSWYNSFAHSWYTHMLTRSVAKMCIAWWNMPQIVVHPQDCLWCASFCWDLKWVCHSRWHGEFCNGTKSNWPVAIGEWQDTLYPINVWFIHRQRKPRGRPCCFSKKLWRNVHGVQVLQTHTTQTKHMYIYIYIYTFYCILTICFVRYLQNLACSLANCLQDVTHRCAGHRWLIFFRYIVWKLFIFSLFFFFSALRFKVQSATHLNSWQC